jgi:hypothetical protein
MKFFPKLYGIILELVYGQEVVLPIEVNLDAYRLAKQNDLSIIMHHNMMMDNIDDVTNKRMQALKDIERDKAQVS